MGRYQDAADVHITEGRRKEAIEVLIADTKSDEAAARVAKYSLEEVWQNTSFGRKIQPQDSSTVEYLTLATRMDNRSLTPSQRDQVCPH